MANPDMGGNHDDRHWHTPAHHQQPQRHSGLFGRGIERTIGLTALAFALIVGGFVVKDAVLASGKDKSGVKTSLVQRLGDNARAYSIEGYDNSGRYAMFDVVVLTKDYGWVLGSSEELEREGQRLTPADIEQRILAPRLRNEISTAEQIIAVGIASQEGDLKREIARGQARANTTAALIRSSLSENVPVYTLNLGRYLEPCEACETTDTSWQRPFVVIAVREADDGTNIRQALHMALSDTENLPSPSRYSSFDMRRTRAAGRPGT